MGGPSGSSGVPSNSSSTAVAYQPTAQGGADTLYQALLGGFAGSLSSQLSSAFNSAFGMPAGSNPFSGTPGGVAYSATQPWLTAFSDPNNPGYLGAAAGAGTAAGTSGTTADFGNAVSGVGNTVLGGLPGALSTSSGISTGTQNLLGGLISVLGPQVLAQGGAALGTAQPTSNTLGNAAGSMASSLGSIIHNLSAQGSDQANAIGNLLNTATPADFSDSLSNATTLNNYGNSVLNTAFDPQNALFNQQKNLLTQQAAAANAAAGLGGSAYGASNTANALGNFDINWQNQQLARQESALPVAQSAYSEAQQLPYSVANELAQIYPTTQNLQTNPLSAGSTIGGQIGNLAQGAATMPANIDNAYAGAGSTLGNLGSTAANLSFSPLANAAGLGSSAAGLGSSGAGLESTAATLAGLLYNTQSTATNNVLSALGNQVNLGNQQFTIPQQLANDLESYLQLGQAASGLSGQLGALGQQELGSSLAGIGSALGTGSNLLFGSQGLSGALGLGSSGLLGGLGSSAPILSATTFPGVSTAFDSTGALTDIAGGGDIGSGLVAAGATTGGGFGLSSLLPFGAAS